MRPRLTSELTKLNRTLARAISIDDVNQLGTGQRPGHAAADSDPASSVPGAGVSPRERAVVTENTVRLAWFEVMGILRSAGPCPRRRGPVGRCRTQP